MKVIAGSRRSGRTLQLIQMAHDNPHLYLVVSDKDEVDRVAKIAKSLDLSIRFPMTYRELIELKGAWGHLEYAIDNIENFTQYFLRNKKITAFTVTI